jgi:hypothetical protein
MSTQMPTSQKSPLSGKKVLTIPSDDSEIVEQSQISSTCDDVTPVASSKTISKSKGAEKQTEFTEEEISAVSIHQDGFFIENWTSTTTIPAKIVEITKDYVMMDCVLDEGVSRIEKRKFIRSLIRESDLYIDSIIAIKIFERPGKTIHEFINGANLGLEQYFEDNFDYDSLDFGKPIR